MKFLKQLTETPGVPGREERVRELILKETKGLWDETRIDGMGNLICRVAPKAVPQRKGGAAKGPRGRSAADTGRQRQDGGPLKVMISCHIDEIGFYVRSIDDSGRLRIQNAGGFDTRNLFARRVLVQGRKDLLGVLNPVGKPIHLATEEEKKKVPQISEFFVDLFRPKEEVLKLVTIGDPVSLIQPFEQIGEICNGKCMDNRVASWVAINAIRKVAGRNRCEIYYVATVQEEVGCRGAGPSAFGIEPDIGIALDTTLACDTPGIDKTECVSELGKGVALKVMDAGAISNRGLLDEFIALATRNKISYQLEILPLGRTDQSSIQQARTGLRTMTLSIPTRYIHTITESVHRKDLEAAVDLLAAWLETPRA